MKTILCILIERLHRYVFDNIYVSDNRAWGAYYHKKWFHPLASEFLKLCFWVYPDYRRHLKKRFPNSKRYQRYSMF